MEAPGTLNLIGGILCLIFAALVGAMGSFMAFVPMVGMLGALFWIFAAWGVVVGIMLIVAARRCERDHTWATIGLVFSILGLVTFQGFFVGPLLGIIGSALAFGHEPKKRR